MPSRELIYRVSISTSDAKRQAQNVRATFEAELRQISVGKLDTSSLKGAQGQAKALAAELERAAKAGDLGQLDTTGIQRAVSEAQALRTALEQAGSAANNIKILSGGNRRGGGDDISGIISQLLPGGLGTLGGAFAGGFVATAVIAGVRELGQELSQTARRGAVFQQLGDVLDSYTASVNTNSQAMIDAAKKAAQGTISEYELILNANRALQFEVAKSPEQFAKLIELSTALGRAQGISDTQALEFLTTGLARESRLILDNLGLIINVESATSKYAATLGKTANELTAAERKQALLDEAFRQGAVAIEANRAAYDSAATQFERFDANIQNLKDSFGKLLAIMSAGGIEAMANAVAALNQELQNKGTAAGAETDLQRLRAIRDQLQQGQAVAIPGFGQINVNAQSLAAVEQAITDTEAKLRQLAAAERVAGTSMQEAAMLSYQAADAHGEYQRQLEATRQREQALSQERLAEQSVSVDKALLSRAEKSVDVVGADKALQMYRQVKADAEAALSELAASGVTDATELQFRTAEILTGLLAPFDELEAKASAIDLGATIGNFDQVGTALAGLNAGFVDFLPGLSAAREELVTLSTEMALTGQITDEQAARLEYLAAVAYSAADGGSALSQVVGDLGTDFLESNSYAAELVNQLFLAEAAYASGAITGDIYAGITTILTGRLLTLAQGAGIATGAIYALNQAQAGLASAGGLAVGGNIANRIQSTQQTIAREQNRREQERYNRDLARSQERSAGRAGKLLEDGAKKASQELKSALDKVPGLFSASQVTEQDMKDTELGVYQEKADEYLRRLRDEVQNGRDWEDVSIEEARAGLERAGLQIGETAEQTLMFLERAINDSSLYSAVENIPIFINEEAVKLTQELQNKSEEGRKNIYEYFGIQVDEAVGAATGGGGGAAIEVRPPEFIDIDPYTEGLQTGLDEYVNTNGELIKEKMANAPSLIFDPAMLFDPESLVAAAQKKTEAAAAQYKAALDTAGLPMGPMAKPTVTVTADASAQAWGPVVAGTQPAQIALAPTIDTAELQAQLDAITAPTLTATIVLPNDAANQLVLDLGNQLGQQANILISHGVVIGRALISGMTSTLSADTSIATSIQPQLDAIKSPSLTATISLPNDAGEQLALDIGNQLGQQANVLISHGAVVGKALISGMSAALSVDSEGNAQIDFAGFVANNLGAQAQTFIAQGRGIASLLQQGLTEGMAPAEGEAATGGMAMQISSITLAEGVRAPDVSVLGKIDKFSIDQTALYDARVSIPVEFDLPQQQTNTDGSAGANAITPLITDINTQIRSSQEEIKNQGITIAMILMAGISAHFRGGQSSGGEQAATPLADALMTNVSAQFSAVQNMFYAIGFGPAKSVESGFKGYGYSGLSSGLMDALTNGIRADAENYMQRGATIAGYVQSGMNQQFSAEAGVRSAIAAGAAWGNAFMQGVFEALNGAGFVDQISTQVIDGITGELEQP